MSLAKNSAISKISWSTLACSNADRYSFRNSTGIIIHEYSSDASIAFIKKLEFSPLPSMYELLQCLSQFFKWCVYNTFISKSAITCMNWKIKISKWSCMLFSIICCVVISVICFISVRPILVAGQFWNNWTADPLLSLKRSNHSYWS